MNILDNITLIIPTHYRHNYLNRILSYYEDIDIKILVADSTDKEFSSKDNFKIDYYHYPDRDITYKLQDIVNRVKTPYVFFCADDDFWVKESIISCIDFLEKNLDYSSTQGKYLRFTNKENISFTPAYLHAKSVEHQEIYQRLNADMENYMPLFYAMHRSEVLKRAFNDNYKTNINHPILSELSVSIYSLVYGKHRLLDLLTYARDSESPATTVKRDSLEKIVKNESYKKEYEQFKSNISKFISEEELELDGDKIIENALQRNISNLKKEVLKGRVIKIIYPLFPFIPIIKQKLKIKKIFATLKSVKGYPISDEKAIASWNNIQNIIKKYNI